MLTTLFNEVLYRPLFNALIFLYNIIPGHYIWIAILVLTILIRLILWPVSYSSAKSRKTLAEIQPKIKEIQKKYKNKEEQSKELMSLYKERKANPFGGCLPMIIQIIVILALYRVFYNAFSAQAISDVLYPFIQDPGFINFNFLGINLTEKSVIMAILAAASQFIYSKLMGKQMAPSVSSGGDKQAQIQKNIQKQMTYGMPFFVLLIGMGLPAGLTFYWFLSNIIGFLQDYLIYKKINQKSANP